MGVCGTVWAWSYHYLVAAPQTFSSLQWIYLLIQTWVGVGISHCTIIIADVVIFVRGETVPYYPVVTGDIPVEKRCDVQWNPS